MPTHTWWNHWLQLPSHWTQSTWGGRDAAGQRQRTKARHSGVTFQPHLPHEGTALLHARSQTTVARLLPRRATLPSHCSSATQGSDMDGNAASHTGGNAILPHLSAHMGAVELQGSVPIISGVEVNTSHSASRPFPAPQHCCDAQPRSPSPLLLGNSEV